ncbi:hypothetical protein [Leeia oryzae]|uniref:hypothetical protein n=1 Tax=Leeia oryzae TaxID=356662 RepID=UPI0003685EC1|nr:hypothetical protein [Leeia oryzae]
MEEHHAVNQPCVSKDDPILALLQKELSARLLGRLSLGLLLVLFASGLQTLDWYGTGKVLGIAGLVLMGWALFSGMRILQELRRLSAHASVPWSALPVHAAARRRRGW